MVGDDARTRFGKPKSAPMIHSILCFILLVYRISLASSSLSETGQAFSETSFGHESLSESSELHYKSAPNEPVHMHALNNTYFHVKEMLSSFSTTASQSAEPCHDPHHFDTPVSQPAEPCRVLHIHASASYVHQRGLGLGVVFRINDHKTEAQTSNEHNYRELSDRLTSAGLAHHGVDNARQAARYALLHGLRCTQTLLRERTGKGLAKVSKAILYLDSRPQRLADGKAQSTIWRDIWRSVRKINKQSGVEVDFRQCDRQDKIVQKDRVVAMNLANRRGQKAFKGGQKQETVQKTQDRGEEGSSTAAKDDISYVQSLHPYAKGSENDFFSLVIREK